MGHGKNNLVLIQAFSNIRYYQYFSFLLILQIKNGISFLTCISYAEVRLVLSYAHA
jgi:hypothetical protein